MYQNVGLKNTETKYMASIAPATAVDSEIV
jgi:hypothetical protein